MVLAKGRRYDIELSPMPDKAKAAFFDVDGTLVRTNIVHAFAFYAMNQGSILGTAWQTARTFLSIPLFMATDRINRKAFNELFYGYYKGQSEDRLVTLADELFEDVLRPAIYARSPRLVGEEHGARRLQECRREHPVHDALAQGEQPLVPRWEADLRQRVQRPVRPLPFAIRIEALAGKGPQEALRHIRRADDSS